MIFFYPVFGELYVKEFAFATVEWEGFFSGKTLVEALWWW